MTVTALSFLDLDRRRRDAFVAADTAELEQLFDDALVWVHANAASDSKNSLIERVASGTARYLSIEVSEVSEQHTETAIIGSGRSATLIDISGEVLNLESVFTGVWLLRGDEWRLTNWQSTSTQPPR